MLFFKYAQHSRTLAWSLCALAALSSGGCGGGADDSTAGGGGPGGGPGGGGGASAVPIYILIGGTAKPSVTDVYLDNDPERGTNQLVRGGEIFIMAKDPLTASTHYTVTYDITAGGLNSTGSFGFTTGGSALMTARTGSVVQEINAYRGDCGYAGSDLVTVHDNLTTSAQRHAGYQAETNAISHGESDKMADFYVHSSSAARMHIANGGSAPSDPIVGNVAWNWPAGSNTVSETIATNTGVTAVGFLWNTVYHRIPMMRKNINVIGYGDRDSATSDALFVDAVSPPYSGAGTSSQQFLTINFGGDSTAQELGVWPKNGQTGISTTFNTDSESPDPIGGTYNGTPADNAVGVPIHIILPTTANITAITVSLSTP